MSIPKITTKVEALQRAKDRAVVASSLSDRERLLNKLRTLLDNPEGIPTEQVALKTADFLGKSIGLYKDVIETHQPRSVEEIQAELERHLAALDDPPDSAVH